MIIFFFEMVTKNKIDDENETYYSIIIIYGLLTLNFVFFDPSELTCQ